MNRIGVLAVVAAAGVALLPGTAVAAGSGLSSHKVSGVQSEVSCVSATLCVLVGYNSHSVGDVVPVSHGKPGAVDTLKGTSAVSSISCVGSHGCVALAQDNGGTKVRFVKISSHGHVSSSKTVTPPAEVSLSALACTSVTSCVVGGTLFGTHMSIEVGIWNGTKLSLHKVHGVKGGTTLGVQGVGCDGGTCWIVGTTLTPSGQVGIALPVTKHQVGSLQKVTAVVQLGGVACSSSTQCYADGFQENTGVIVDLSKTKVGGHHGVSSAESLAAIACSGKHCTAVGDQQDNDSPTLTEGLVIALTSGKVTGTHPVAAASSFTGVAQPSSGFLAAVGPGSDITSSHSEVTTG
jgi:hypothetical protein